MCKECFSEMLKKPRKEKEREIIKPQKRAIKTKRKSLDRKVNFSGYEDLEQIVLDMAKEEMRSFSMQVLYMLKKYLDKSNG